ncbi:PspC domain-containing protein [Aureisphaera galaxeae]|uniref:PspC domain-containing protein n=1 Tax=Aureisphaera galaxeae TaxID=1538023 RepID=UPI00234FFA4B|nr:PspC domain-containing protein [Aureisphaera galaxeae]MDC8003516.1 PspC domain-containing protein [Aureisphaera galaxeae]
MNKTVNINLAGTFFHIDEDAFGKLQRYLEAIRKSLSDPQGSDEIIKDIEARIAELFSEKLERSTQVVTLKELDEVISVMGQPEDYMVDEEIFEDAPPRSQKRAQASHKQLFRDEDNKFIGGVSSGLSHYLGLDAVWVRLIWILLTLFSSGFFIVVYILFWILVPAAVTTSEKLKMTGEPINISNIEKKFKEGYENVSEKVKNVDYDKYGNRVKSGTSGFFDTLGSVLLTLFKIFVKFFAAILVFVAIVTLISLIISLFFAGSIDIWGHGDWVDFYNVGFASDGPLWLVSLLTLFAVGIPFFGLLILGLKLLINNLKSIGTPAKVILFVVWLASLIGLGILGIREATERAFDGEFTSEYALPAKAGDTVKLKMVSNENYEYQPRRRGRLTLEYDENDEKILYSTDVRLIVRSTTDSVGRLIIEKRAEGSDYLSAKERAQAIDYDYNFDGETLALNAYLTTAAENKLRDQEVEVIVYLPVGTIIYADNNTYTFHRNDSYYRDILDNGDEEQYLMIEDGKTRCLDCPDKDEFDSSSKDDKEEWEEDWDEEWDESGGFYIKDENGDFIKVNRNGLKIKDSDGDKVIIDTTDGIQIEATDETDTLKVNIGN